MIGRRWPRDSPVDYGPTSNPSDRAARLPLPLLILILIVLLHFFEQSAFLAILRHYLEPG